MTTPNHPKTDPSDDSFDTSLKELISRDIPVDSPVLARAVLTRLAEDGARAPDGPALDHVLSHPAQAFGAYGLLLLGAGVLGYAALPLLGGDEVAMLSALTEMIGMAGAF